MRHMRWLYLFLCSLNVAVIVVSVQEMKGHSSFLGALEYPLDVSLFPFLRYVYQDYSFKNGYIIYLALSLLATAIIFPLLLLVRRVSSLRPLLLVSAGIAGVTAYPLGVLLLRSFYHIPSMEIPWLLLEITVAALCSVRYSIRKWTLPSLFTIAFLVVHFVSWGWLAHSYVGFPSLVRSYGFWSIPSQSWTLLRFAFLLPSFLATLSWAAYVGRAPEDWQRRGPPISSVA